MTLHDVILERIRQNGPLTISDYMTECLLHPNLGYYTGRDPLGQQGDFTTAPEISQIFGELIGLAMVQTWMDQGRPEQFTLAELGPGRGTLMADLLRATCGVPGFHDAAKIALVEVSPALRKVQAKALKDYSATWYSAVDDLSQQPLFLIANEFFDALPIRQFLRDGGGWRERLVGERDGTLAFGLGPQAPQVALTQRLDDTRDGDLVELCPAAPPTMHAIAGRICDHGGAALIVDYGDWRSLGDTLQAVRKHRHAQPLADPGLSDLTAHVDFETLAMAARGAGCAHSRLTAQGVFLERLGITARARALAQRREGPVLDDVIRAHRRLTHPEDMGNLFKVLGVFPAEGAPPPGLEK